MVKQSTKSKISTAKKKATTAKRPVSKRSSEAAFEPTKVALAVSALAASTLLLLAIVGSR